MWKEVSKPEVRKLTPELASEMSGLPTFDGDRDRLNAKGRARCRWLGTKLDRGEFFSPVWSTVLFDGTLYRIDGGHSSSVLSECDGLFPAGSCAIVRRFSCDTKEDFANLFSQFDPKRSTRSLHDNVKAHKAVEDGLAEVSPTTTGLALAGIAAAYYGFGEGEGRLDEDERIQLIHSHADFIAWYRRYSSAKHLVRAGVVAAIFHTRKISPLSAEAFWDLVRDASHSDRDNASRAIERFLRDQVASTRSKSVDKWDSRAYFVKCIHAWNAYRRNETTSLAYHRNATLPKPR